jgi:cellulose 1,4-beta-cellobiosidase
VTVYVGGTLVAGTEPGGSSGGSTGGGGDTTAPSAPTGVKVTGTTSSSVALSWTAATDNVGVTGYRVYRGTTLAGSPTGTSFTDTGLSASTAYSYTVKAVDAAGNVSAASSAVSATTSAASDTTAPSAPTGLTVTGTTSSSVALSWSAATDNVGVTGYQVFRGSTLVGSPTTTSFTDTGLAASTAYTYTVKAVDAAGNVSAASAAVSATTASSGGGTGGTGCAATLHDDNDWGSGFNATITVTNTGTSSMSGWTVTWSWPGNQTITNYWNATVTGSGSSVTATNLDYNGAIAPGGNTTFGIQVSYAGSNAAPTLACTAS